MGKAIIIPGMSFSTGKLDVVHFPEKQIESISIVSPSTITSDSHRLYVEYTPVDTSQMGVVWSIVQGAEYATIDQTGLLTINQSANHNDIVVRARSTADTGIYNDKSINVTYHAELQANTISVSATTNSITATLSNNAASTLSIVVKNASDQSTLGTISIASGNNSGTISIDESTSSRTASITYSPASDSTYHYILSSNSVNIPAAEPVVLNLLVVGPNNIDGDKEAGKYFVLNKDTMRQVVGTLAEVTDDNKEYVGPIVWTISHGSDAIDLVNSQGTCACVNIRDSANSASCIITASIKGNSALHSLAATYQCTDYEIRSFADLQVIETAVNNGTEASALLNKTLDSTYTATNGNGFTGARFRLTHDIDCDNGHVEIGNWNTSTGHTEFFGGVFDGCGYKISGVGGNCGIYGAAGSGGKVGSVLVGHGKGCTLKNFSISGSVTNVASRGFAPIIAMASDQCLIKGVFNNLNISTTDDNTAGMACMAGWAAVNGSITIEDSIFSGSIYNHFSISGFTNIGTSNIRRCSSLGTYTFASTTRTGGYLTVLGTPSTVGTVENCYAMCTRSAIASTTAMPVGVHVSEMPIYCYDASIVNINSEAYGGIIEENFYTRAVEGAYENCFTTRPSMQNSTFKTAGDMKVENLFPNSQDDNWIYKNGCYPILNNQYAVHPLVLQGAKNNN